MTRTFSRFSLAILRAGALICMVLLLSGLGLAQKAVTARATIPFNFWAEGYEFQAGDYLFDNAVPGSASIHRGGNHGCFFRISTHSVWMLSGAGIPARVVTEPYDSLNFASTVLSLTGQKPPVPDRVVTLIEKDSGSVALAEERRFVQPQRGELNEPDTLKNPIAAGTRLVLIRGDTKQ